MTYNDYSKILLHNTDSIKYKIKNKKQSVCQILNLPSSQSIVSQLGFITENSINEYIKSYTTSNYLKNKFQQIKNHQIDILFEYNNIVYYFECKNNIELDTEKSIKCKEKLHNVHKFLKNKFHNKEICCKILCMWLNNTSNHNKIIKSPISNNDIYYYNDFFNIFNINVTDKQFNFKNKKLRIKLLNNMKEIKIVNQPISIDICKYKYLSLERQHQLLKRKYSNISE